MIHDMIYMIYDMIRYDIIYIGNCKSAKLGH